MSSDKTQIKEKSRKHSWGKRKWLPVAGTVVCGLFLTYFISITFINSALNDYKNTMKSGMGYGRMEYEHNVEKDDLYYISNFQLMQDLTGLVAFAFEENGYSSDVRDELLSDAGTYCYYYFFRGSIDPETETCNGYVNKEARGIALPRLTDEEMYTLLSTGSFRRTTDTTYTSSPVGSEGYVILSWNTEDILKKQSVLSAYSDKYEEQIIRVNLETGLIEDATNADYIGSTCDSVVSLDYLKSMKPGEAGVLRLSDGTLTYGIVDDSSDEQLFCSYVDFVSLLPDIIRTITLPVVLGWAFLLLMLFYVLKFTRVKGTKDNGKTDEKAGADDSTEPEEKNVETAAVSESKEENTKEDNTKEDNTDYKKYIHLFGNYYADRRLYIHGMGILLFAIFLIVISLMYVQTLIRFSTQNVRANNNLVTLESMVSINDENSALMVEDFRETREILIDSIAGYYMRHPDQQSDESLMRLDSKMPNTTSISIFDKECTVVYGTDGNVGYTISADENRAESVCWDVLKGVCDSAVYGGNYAEPLLVVTGRRQSEAGVIRIISRSAFVDEFDGLTDIENSVSAAYFGSAEKAYIVKETPTVLHWMNVGESKSEDRTNNLSDAMLNDGYAGITRIAGNNYYINTRNSENSEYIFISARLLKELIGLDNWKSLAFIVIALLLQQIILIVDSSYYLDIEPEQRKNYVDRNIFLREELDESLMNEAFRKTARNMVIITLLMIALLLGFDSMYGKTSLLGYLFQSNWEKGFNLFSVTMILILSAGVIVCGAILQALIFFFTKNMGPRGVTIGRLLSSIIKFVILIFVVINILIDLGVSGSVLLTGAGVAGVVISFCAQSTLNDFLSGFFIVFENMFNIGDWVTINGFRGQVVEIGIVKTKLAHGNVVQCVSNSDLKSVSLMPGNGQGAVVLIDIAYKEDVDKVMELIRANADVYLKEIPEIFEGPFVEGIVELKDSGVTLRIWAHTDQCYAAAAERSIRRITKRIFDENNITIPFPQVTVHTED